jgi:hypothetical protein
MSDVVVARGERGKWLPGQSGNPQGRVAILNDIKALCRENTREAFETVLGVMRDKKTPPATKLAAAQEVLNRGHGKVQAADFEGGEQLVIKLMKFAEERPAVVIDNEPVEVTNG